MPPRTRRARASNTPRDAFRPNTSGEPHRPWASLNVRLGEKRVFDVLHKWWAIERGADLAQWDAFSILICHYLATSKDIPPELALRLEDGRRSGPVREAAQPA